MKPIYNGLVFKWDDDKLYHLDIEEGFVSSYILTAGSPKRIRMLESFLDDVVVREGGRGITIIKGIYKDILVTGFSSGMGPASMAITMTEILYNLISRSNLGFIIRMGTSGSLQDFIPRYSIVIANSVVRDESTSCRIIFPEYPAYMDPVIYLSLLKSAYEHGYMMGKNLFLGTIQSKDDLYFYEGFQNSPLKEVNEERFNSLRRMGVLATEMEASIMPILRDYFRSYAKISYDKEVGIYVGAILLVLKDTLKKEELLREEEKLVHISLDALVIIDNFIKGGESLDNILRSISS